MSKDYTICLAGNPNTGKSSIFNKLTKLKQHTGNWSGKTVKNAKGKFTHKGNNFTIVDVPGIYSLFGLSEEEIVARNYICFEKNDAIIVVCDATSLTRNLNLVFQTLEYNKNVILAINLIDEAQRKGITLNRLGFIISLGIPVIFTSAKTNEGIEQLKDTILEVVEGRFNYDIKEIVYPEINEKKIEIIEQLGKIKNKEVLALRILDAGDDFFEILKDYYPEEDFDKIMDIRKKYNDQDIVREKIILKNFQIAEEISNKYIYYNQDSLKNSKKIDSILTSKLYGVPIMFLLLLIVFFLTIKLANYPSTLLFHFFNWLEIKLYNIANQININIKVVEFLLFGVYRTLTQIISVMLPPMAIFFPIFTILEDLGYLPRIAYNLDHHFKRAGCHGKQCLSMCMGFGCNAAGVMGTRIIDSPRERLIAILTNNFVPCNGRFPIIFTLAACFFTNYSSSITNAIIPAIVAAFIIIFGILTTLFVSYSLSKTILKGIPSTFTLELPPYRKPNIPQILYTSFISRTIFVLGRAVIFAAPIGAIIWIFSNTFINDISIINHLSILFNPFGKLLGMDGVIILAFILALPANEIVLPLIILGYTTSGYLIQTESIADITHILGANGWNAFTAICVLLFSLLHFPCTTTLLTIYKETKSKRWTFFAFIIPTLIAILVCFVINFIKNILF